jgi:hypothetical protein
MIDEPYRELTLEASHQWGLFTAAQAERLGVTRDRISGLVDDGHALPMEEENLYRFAAAPVDVMLDGLRSTILAFVPWMFLRERLRTLGADPWDGAIVSHVSAACLVHDLGTLTPHRLEFTVNAAPNISGRDLDFYVKTGPPDWQLIDGMPVTTITQTIADLHAEHVDYGHVGDVIYDALMRSCVDFNSIAAALDAVSDGKGRETMLHMLDVIGAPRDVVEALELVSLRNRHHGNRPANGQT